MKRLSQTTMGLFSLIVMLLMSVGTTVRAQEPSKKSPRKLQEVVVESERVTGSKENRVSPMESTSVAPDAAAMVEEAAGADLTSNGPISGQVQYRGMTGDRMNVQINNHAVKPVGPNWMDPPLHYLPRTLMKDITVHRGIAPVSSGIMTLGGSVKASMKTSQFVDSDNYEFQGNLFGIGRTVDDGYSGGGLFSYANRNRRFHVFTSTDQGDDRNFPGGTVRPTEYDREISGLGFGLRDDGDTYGIEFRHTDTGKTGNPSLPMDIMFFNTEQVEARFSTEWNGQPLQVQVNGADADHKMNNYTLRPAPDFVPPGPMNPNPGPAFSGTDRRFVRASSDDLGFHTSTSFGYEEGTLKLGFDLTQHDHDATVFDPDSTFFVESFEDINKDQLSGYTEWSGPMTDVWTFDGGLRITRVQMEAGRAQADRTIPSGGATPPPLEQLRNRFNSSDRDETDYNVDLVTEFSRSVNSNLDFTFGLARKTRSPSYIERFSWVPVEATAGLADGNNHVGNLDLDPEVSRDIEASFDWSFENYYVTPRLFYRDIDDYIQGTPNGITSAESTVSTVNGDASPLKYNNVDALIYGMDATWGYDLPQLPEYSVDGTVSYLKGERSDTDDDLYRFAPPEANVRVHYHPDDWRFTAEGIFVDEQDDVSETNNESTTPGYGLLNLKARWTGGTNTTVTLGLNNVFDKTYREHLAGFNRVSTSDVAVGRRLPGNERNLVVNLSYNW